MADVWKQLASPLRPSAEDQELYWSFIGDWIGNYDCPRILILGVTPELYQLPWPARHEIRAMDRARGMIEQVWPGPRGAVLEADWREMPLPNESCDVVLCDGGLLLLDAAGERELIDRLHAVLAPGGRCVFRLFVLPEMTESTAAVMDDLLASRIANLNLLKLRLGSALQKSPNEGLAVYDMWKMLREVEPDWNRLAARLGWPVEQLRAIDAYRESPARYRYNTQAATEAAFCEDDRFTFLGSRVGKYPLAERCPVVAFARR
jgi:SAM-dependent methyltransferase